MKIGGREFDVKNHTFIMGILNVTPDSFSDGGKWNDYDQAMRHVEELILGGAAVIDVGGESTRPGYEKVVDQEEIDRVVPVIEGIRKNYDVTVSIDTYKSTVADAALKAGADMVNDIWGFQYDPMMAHVVKLHHASCCLMHNRKDAVYEDFLSDVLADLDTCIRTAKTAGIPDDKILLDPGIGFGKTLQQNLLVMKNLNRFHELGYPLLLGASRKSMIGLTLDLPKDQREEGTLVTTVMAVQSHYGFVRVHDAEKSRRAIVMAEAIRDVHGLQEQ